MKIKLIREKCVSIAACVALAPQTFDLDEEGLVVIRSETGDAREAIIAAAKACPVVAIELYEDDGTQIWPESKPIAEEDLLQALHK